LGREHEKSSMLSCRRGTARRYESVEILSTAAQLNEQEGQHPVTGQRAANFRLLASQ